MYERHAIYLRQSADRPPHQVTTAMPDATLYATLPDLLKAVSPLYRQAWDGKLFSSLADIAQQECDEDETK